MVFHVAPLSVLRLWSISLFEGESSVQIMKMSDPVVIMRGMMEEPSLLLILTTDFSVAPLSVLLRKRISESPSVVSSHVK